MTFTYFFSDTGRGHAVDVQFTDSGGESANAASTVTASMASRRLRSITVSTPKLVTNEQTPAPESIPLERQHSDLRIAPVDVPQDLDMTDPLNHFDLRIVEANLAEEE
ncbi:MAG TPA: hypothetical protein VOA88_05940 [Candidatus Dormibacteraeota bacterium]|nr:hypothetical protein [Candidatus Dormibacteraeota bacterium]